jgi:hypothetical protein
MTKPTKEQIDEIKQIVDDMHIPLDSVFMDNLIIQSWQKAQKEILDEWIDFLEGYIIVNEAEKEYFKNGIYGDITEKYHELRNRKEKEQ